MLSQLCHHYCDNILQLIIAMMELNIEKFSKIVTVFSKILSLLTVLNHNFYEK